MKSQEPKKGYHPNMPIREKKKMLQEVVREANEEQKKLMEEPKKKCICGKSAFIGVDNLPDRPCIYCGRPIYGKPLQDKECKCVWMGGEYYKSPICPVHDKPTTPEREQDWEEEFDKDFTNEIIDRRDDIKAFIKSLLEAKEKECKEKYAK